MILLFLEYLITNYNCLEIYIFPEYQYLSRIQNFEPNCNYFETLPFRNITIYQKYKTSKQIITISQLYFLGISKFTKFRTKFQLFRNFTLSEYRYLSKIQNLEINYNYLETLLFRNIDIYPKCKI